MKNFVLLSTFSPVASSGHLFDYTMSELNHKLKPQGEPSFSMAFFRLKKVIDVLLTTDTKRPTGADNLDAFFLNAFCFLYSLPIGLDLGLYIVSGFK